MGEAAQALGTPVSIEWKGKRIAFSPMDNFEVIANYECHLEEQAWKGMRRAKRWLDPIEYARNEDGTRRDIQAGLFAFGSEHYQKSLNSKANGDKMLWLMAQHARSDVTEQEIAAIRSDEQKHEEILVKLGLMPDPQQPAERPATT